MYKLEKSRIFGSSELKVLEMLASIEFNQIWED